MNRVTFLPREGAAYGAMLDAGLFGVGALVWMFLWTIECCGVSTNVSGGEVLAPLMFAIFALLWALAAAGSAVIGALAGYIGVKRRSAVAGAMTGLAAGALAAIVATVYMGWGTAASPADEDPLSMWMRLAAWLSLPAGVAGAITGRYASRFNRSVSSGSSNASST